MSSTTGALGTLTPDQQYGRSISLTVGQSEKAKAANIDAAVELTFQGDEAALYRADTAPDTLDLSALRVVFTIAAASASTPRQLNARIYNVSRTTAHTIEQEFDTVSLSAGYQGNNRLLFSGTIQQKRYGRENATDTFLDIFASDGYEALASCFISQSIAAGWTPLDFYNTIISFAKPYGIIAATTDLPPASPGGIRPLVLFGSFQSVCEQLGVIVGMQWVIDHGVLRFVPKSKAAVFQQLATPSMVSTDTSTAAVLSPSTGLIGIPVQTLDGIEATCLLNSKIKPGGLVKIDSSLITQGKNDLSVGAVNAFPSIAADGLYRVMWTEHEGDTRGTPWYTHLVADALTGPLTIQQSAIEKAGFNGGL